MKQQARYQERRVKPRRADDAMRITLVMLSHTHFSGLLYARGPFLYVCHCTSMR